MNRSWGEARPPAAQPLAPADLESCLTLDQRALGGFWSRDQWLLELQDDRRPCLGIHQVGELVAAACGWLVLDELHITLVAVDPLWRRQGLGRLLLAALLHEARGRGATRATLEVATDNAAALALYAALGFVTAGTRRGYYRDGRDAVIQWLHLDAGERFDSLEG